MAGNISHNIVSAFGTSMETLAKQKKVKIRWSAKNDLKKTILEDTHALDEFKRTMNHIAYQADCINNTTPHRVKIVFAKPTAGNGPKLPKGVGVHFKVKTLGDKKNGKGVACNKRKTQTVAIHSPEIQNFLQDVSVKLSAFAPDLFPRAPKVGEKTFKESITIGTSRSAGGTAPYTAPVHGPAPRHGVRFETSLYSHLTKMGRIQEQQKEIAKAIKNGHTPSKKQLETLLKDAQDLHSEICTEWGNWDKYYLRKDSRDQKSLQGRVKQARDLDIFPTQAIKDGFNNSVEEWNKHVGDATTSNLAERLSTAEWEYMRNKNSTLQKDVIDFANKHLDNIEQGHAKIAGKVRKFHAHMTIAQRNNAEEWLENGSYDHLNSLLKKIKDKHTELTTQEHKLRASLQSNQTEHKHHPYSNIDTEEKVGKLLAMADTHITDAGKENLEVRSVLLQKASNHIARAEDLMGIRHTTYPPFYYGDPGYAHTHRPTHRPRHSSPSSLFSKAGPIDPGRWSEDASEKLGIFSDSSSTSSSSKAKSSKSSDSDAASRITFSRKSGAAPSSKAPSLDASSGITFSRKSSKSSSSETVVAPPKKHKSASSKPIDKVSSAHKKQWKGEIKGLEGIIANKRSQALKEMLHRKEKPSITARKGESGFSKQVVDLWYFNNPAKAVKNAYKDAAESLKRQGAFENDRIADRVTRYIKEDKLGQAVPYMQVANLEKQGAFEKDGIAARVNQYIRDGKLDKAENYVKKANAVAQSQAKKHAELTSKLEVLTKRLGVISTDRENYLIDKSGYRFENWNAYYQKDKAVTAGTYSALLNRARADLDAVKKAKASDGTILRSKQKQEKLDLVKATLAQVEGELKRPKGTAPGTFGDAFYGAGKMVPVGPLVETQTPFVNRPIFPTTRSQRDRALQGRAQWHRQEAERFEILEGL